MVAMIRFVRDEAEKGKGKISLDVKNFDENLPFSESKGEKIKKLIEEMRRGINLTIKLSESLLN